MESKSSTTTNKQDTSETSSVLPSINNEMSDMSMSIEVDMVDSSGIVKD